MSPLFGPFGEFPLPQALHFFDNSAGGIDVSCRMLNRRLLCALAVLLAGSPVAANDPRTASPTETLVVWTRAPEASAADALFLADHLPAIEAVAAELGIPVHRLDAALGAPPEIHGTPLLVYQSARGRAIFQGRTAEVDKVRNFLRAQRVLAPQSAALTKHDIDVLRRGRLRVAAPIKITPLAGALPDDFDADAFAERARRAVRLGLEYFRAAERVDLEPSDRLFYLDFYPHRSAEGTLSVAVRLFSQFHCIEPVFERLEDPVKGAWDGEIERVFANAAWILEQQILDQMTTSRIGDALAPLPSSTPETSWEALGLALPEAPSGAAASLPADLELPLRWELDTPEDDAPRLLFRFPPPLDRYSGEVGELRGAFRLAEDRSLAALDGWIEADAASVTMGDAMLDDAIHSKMLHADEHPAARFEITEVDADRAPLAFGQPFPLVARGVFQMAGREIPLRVRGQIEPVVGADGAPRLRVEATWNLRLRDPFGIEGPDGPTDARDTLVFHFAALLRPADDS